MARPTPTPPKKAEAQVQQAKKSVGSSASSGSLPKNATPPPIATKTRPPSKIEEEEEELDEENSDCDDSDDEDSGPQKITKKKRIWMGWSSCHQGLGLATTGMIVYLVGVIIGGLFWASYVFTKETIIFFLALAISVLAGLAFLVLDFWGRFLMAKVPPEKVPAGGLLFALSLGAFALCYVCSGLAALIPMAAIGAVLLLGLGYWLATFGLWLTARGLHSNKVANLILTQGICSVVVNLIGLVLFAVMVLALGVKPEDIQNFAGQNGKAMVLIVGMGIVAAGNLGLYFWSINLCMQVLGILGEKIGK